MSTGASKPEVRPLADIIADLKAALGMTTAQGLYGAGRRTRWFRPRNLRRPYDPNASDARIRIATDIEAIAHEGGHHLERVFGAPLETVKTQHAEELAVPPVPDNPLPAINPTGFSGIELDADTQRTLIETANRMREWRQLAATGMRTRDPSLLYQTAADAATGRRTLQRRLGRPIADALIADLIGDAALPNNGALGQTPYRLGSPSMPTTIDPAMLANYVRERYSATETPQPRVAPTPSPTAVSEGFATFFQRYITDPDNVKREMPGVYVGFEDFLEVNDPGMLEDFESVQITVLSEDYKAYRSTVQHTQPAVSSRWRFLLQMMRRVQESVLEVDRRWVAVVLLGLLILLAVWWMIPHEQDRWIRRDGALACPDEADIRNYLSYSTPGGQRRATERVVADRNCTTLMAQERVRVEALSTDGSRARVRRYRDGATLWLSIPDLAVRQP